MFSQAKDGGWKCNKHKPLGDPVLVIVLGSRPGFGLPEGSGDSLLVLSVSLFDLQMNCF
jgi:hypothetical protein